MKFLYIVTWLISLTQGYPTSFVDDTSDCYDGLHWQPGKTNLFNDMAVSELTDGTEGGSCTISFENVNEFLAGEQYVYTVASSISASRLSTKVSNGEIVSSENELTISQTCRYSNSPSSTFTWLAPETDTPVTVSLYAICGKYASLASIEVQVEVVPRSTNVPTSSPSKSPTASTKEPTTSPTTGLPTTSPVVETDTPTTSPTTGIPTTSPVVETDTPTTSPTTGIPTTSPLIDTDIPTISPTTTPTNSPTTSPTRSPSMSPSASPSMLPTSSPSNSPSRSPSTSPTQSPTVSPTIAPTLSPTSSPTLSPTHKNVLHPESTRWLAIPDSDSKVSAYDLTFLNATFNEDLHGSNAFNSYIESTILRSLILVSTDEFTVDDLYHNPTRYNRENFVVGNSAQSIKINSVKKGSVEVQFDATDIILTGAQKDSIRVDAKEVLTSNVSQFRETIAGIIDHVDDDPYQLNASSETAISLSKSTNSKNVIIIIVALIACIILIVCIVALVKCLQNAANENKEPETVEEIDPTSNPKPRFYKMNDGKEDIYITVACPGDLPENFEHPLKPGARKSKIRRYGSSRRRK